MPAICEPGPYGSHQEECAFHGLSCCAYTSNANPGHSPVWVECTLCKQWVHDSCMRIDGKSVRDEDPFLCGCDRLIDGHIYLER